MKTKVYIVTGFLGAGKTTLVKQILKFSGDVSKTIVLVNEFGQVGIDSALIKKTSDVHLVELSSGCICCSLKTDMIQTLQVLCEKYAPDQVVIEATGVADPLAIIEALEDKRLLPCFRLEKTITVLDSDFWEARDGFGTFFKSQLQQADLILLNKVDTLEKADIQVILKEIQNEYGRSRIIPCLHCNIDPDIFWSGPGTKDPATILAPHIASYDPKNDFFLGTQGKPTAKAAGFISFAFEPARDLDEDLFIEFLNAVPLELFRIKGIVRFAHGTKMLNFVGGKSQWQEWPGTSGTCLVFIGWQVEKEPVLEKLNQCLVSRPAAETIKVLE